jgi:hypothetical protein
MSNAGNTEWIYAIANSIVALLLILVLRTMELCTTDGINRSKVSGRVPFGLGTLSLCCCDPNVTKQGTVSGNQGR